MGFKRLVLENSDGTLSIYILGALRIHYIGEYKPKTIDEKSRLLQVKQRKLNETIKSKLTTR